MEQTTAQLDEPNLTTHKIDEFSEDARQQKQLEEIVHKQYKINMENQDQNSYRYELKSLVKEDKNKIKSMAMTNKMDGITSDWLRNLTVIEQNIDNYQQQQLLEQHALISVGIQSLMPTETKMFNTLTTQWDSLADACGAKTIASLCCDQQQLMQSIADLTKQIGQGLFAYLAKTRKLSTELDHLSDFQLLDILSQISDVSTLKVHKKYSSGVLSVEIRSNNELMLAFEDDRLIFINKEFIEHNDDNEKEENVCENKADVIEHNDVDQKEVFASA